MKNINLYLLYILKQNNIACSIFPKIKCSFMLILYLRKNIFSLVCYFNKYCYQLSVYKAKYISFLYICIGFSSHTK